MNLCQHRLTKLAKGIAKNEPTVYNLTVKNKPMNEQKRRKLPLFRAKLAIMLKTAFKTLFTLPIAIISPLAYYNMRQVVLLA